MERSNKSGKYVLLVSFMFSTFTSCQHINISMIRIVWSIISSLNNTDSITYYISTILIFALESKISDTENICLVKVKMIAVIFSIQKLCKVILLFLAFHAMAVYLS